MQSGKKYIDGRGWKYKVLPGIGQDSFKAAYQKPGKSGDVGWKRCAPLPWRRTPEEAQADLDALAERKGWKEWAG